MTSLRARLVILLVAAIVGVAVLAGFITSRLIDHPDDGSIERTVLTEARIIAALADRPGGPLADVGVEIRESIPDTDIDWKDTARLRSFATLYDAPPGLVVVLADKDGQRQLGLPIGNGSYALLPYSGLPPRPLKLLVSYLSVLVLGAVVISWLAVRKIVRPLELLEQATASIGANGEISHLDEKGPAEVRATAQALNRLSARLKSAVDSRMRLVAAAGHDLRTPMTRMRLRAEFLPPEDQATWLKDLEELDRIADSAIRLVREEVSGEADAEEVRLDRLVGEIGRELVEVGRNVQWDTLERPVAVAGRPLALKRALRNLVDNAAMHGGGASLKLVVESTHAMLIIDDDGPGIPDDLLEQVFEPFFRVDIARRQTHPGAGLGLAIAKEIVNRAGGSIAIENRLGGGLRQTVRLKLAA